MKLEKLYKKSKTGAVVYCEIGTNGNDIIVETGQVGTDKPTFHHTQCEAKNTGRASATTAEEQADKEATAKHVKKIKEGYVLEESGISSVRLAMKVKGYPEQKKNIVFPCWMSPKLDGVNGEIRCEQDWEILSRGGEVYPIVNDVDQLMIQHVERAMKTTASLALNGELYIHGVHLQDIQACTAKANDLTKRLQFHIFEICDTDIQFIDKIELLRSIEETEFVKVVDIIEVNSHEEIEAYHTKCVANGYEGIIIRNGVCIYEYNVRSSNAFKYKIPKDGEYRVIDHNIDKHGHAIFVCVCNISWDDYEKQLREMKMADARKFTKLHTFSVKRKGTDPERVAEAAIAYEKHGEWLKIEFENYSKLHKPLKPVGIVWRKCDINGEPLE